MCATRRRRPSTGGFNQARHPMRLRLVLQLAARSALLSAALATLAGAQAAEPDVVRGRITDDSARAVAGATVMVTRGPDRLTQQTTTDSAGNFSSRFAEGTGDYLVYVSATGFKA